MREPRGLPGKGMLGQVTMFERQSAIIYPVELGRECGSSRKEFQARELISGYHYGELGVVQ